MAPAWRGTGTPCSSTPRHDQTNYQRSMNFVPDPEKVPVVNLMDMSVKLLDFAG